MPGGVSWVIICQLWLLMPLHARQLSEITQTRCAISEEASYCDFEVAQGSLLQGQFGGPEFCCTVCGVNGAKVCCPSKDGMLELERDSWLEESLCRTPHNSTSTELVLLGVQPKGTTDQVRCGSNHSSLLLRPCWP